MGGWDTARTVATSVAVRRGPGGWRDRAARPAASQLAEGVGAGGVPSRVISGVRRMRGFGTVEPCRSKHRAPEMPGTGHMSGCDRTTPTWRG